MLTISINATAAPLVLRALGLTRPEELEENITKVFEQKLQEEARKKFVAESSQPQWESVTEEAVVKLLPHVWGHQQHPAIGEAEEEERGYEAEQGLRMYREAFLRNVRNEYWKDIEEGTLPRTGRVARILLFSCEKGLLESNTELADWQTVKYKSNEMVICPCINDCLGSTWPFKNWDWVQSVFPSETTRNVWNAYLALLFIEAHKSAQKTVSKYLSAAIRNENIDAVRQESEKEVEDARQFLATLDTEAIKRVRIRMVAGQLLHWQTQEVNRYKKNGVLDDMGATTILHALQHQHHELAERNYFEVNQSTHGAH